MLCFCIQLEFSDDIVKIIQAAINSDGGQPEIKKANSMVKSFFIRVNDINSSCLWCLIRGLLPHEQNRLVLIYVLLCHVYKSFFVWFVPLILWEEISEVPEWMDLSFGGLKSSSYWQRSWCEVVGFYVLSKWMVTCLHFVCLFFC